MTYQSVRSFWIKWIHSLQVACNFFFSFTLALTHVMSSNLSRFDLSERLSSLILQDRLARLVWPGYSRYMNMWRCELASLVARFPIQCHSSLFQRSKSLGFCWIHKGRGVQVGRRECMHTFLFLEQRPGATPFNGFRLVDGKTEAEYQHEPEAFVFFLQYRMGTWRSLNEHR